MSTFQAIVRDPLYLQIKAVIVRMEIENATSITLRIYIITTVCPK